MDFSPDPSSQSISKPLIKEPEQQSLEEVDFLGNQTDHEQIKTILKKRLSSIAEIKESYSYHDYSGILQNQIPEEKQIFEQYNIPESLSETDLIIPINIQNKTTTTPLSSLGKSTPILTSETQFEIYKSLNLNLSASSTNILKELELRKVSNNPDLFKSVNLDPISKSAQHISSSIDDISTNKTYTMKGKNFKYKSYKVPIGLNSSKLRTNSTNKDDLFKKIENEQSEESLAETRIINDKTLFFNNLNLNFLNDTLKINDINFLIDSININKFKYTSLYTSEKYIAIGGENGTIAVIEQKNNHVDAFFFLNTKTKSIITCISIKEDNSYIVVGSQNGQISIFSINPAKLIHTIDSLNANSIIDLFIVEDNEKKTNLRFICRYDDSKVYFIKLRKMVGLGIIIPKIEILNEELIIYNLDIGFIDGNIFVCLAVENNILIQNTATKKIIFSLEKPNFISKTKKTLLKFDQNSHNMVKGRLFISWDNCIVMLNYTQKDKETPYSWKLARFLFLDVSSLYLNIITNQVLIIINEDKSIILLHYDDFIEGDILINRGIIRKDNIQTKINNFIENLNWKQFSNNIFSCNRKLGIIFLLNAGNNFNSIYLQSWVNKYNDFYSTDDYIKAMTLLLAIYQNKSKYFTGLPYELKDRRVIISSKIKTIVVDFLIIAKKKNFWEDENNSYDKCISIVIEFLLETDHSNYLFQIILRELESRGLYMVFLEILEFFIYKKKVKNLGSDEILLEIINYYLNNYKTNIVEKLLISLDLRENNENELISLCLEKHLFKGLIYLCSKNDDNFMIPLIKIFSLYLHQLSQDFIHSKTLAFRCLWYIHLCIKGHLITNELMPLEKWKLVIRQLVDWLMKKENWADFIYLDADVSFRLIFMLFKGYPFQIIKKSSDYFNFKTFQNKKNQTIFHYNKKLKTLESSSNYIYLETINYVIEFIIYHEDLLNQNYKENKRSAFYIFILQLFNQSGDYSLNNETLVDTLLFFLKNPDKLNLVLLYEDESLNYLLKDEIEIKKSDSLLAVLKWVRKDESFLKAKEEIFKHAMTSSLNGVLLFLYMKQKKYEESFDLFVHTKNPLFKNKVFEWLSNILMKLNTKDPINLEKLRKKVINKIPELVSISPYRVYKLFHHYSYLYFDDLSIIQNLSKYPRLLYDYIHQIIKAGIKKENFVLEEEIALIYFTNLFQDNKLKKIFDEFKHSYIPQSIVSLFNKKAKNN